MNHVVLNLNSTHAMIIGGEGNRFGKTWYFNHLTQTSVQFTCIATLV